MQRTLHGNRFLLLLLSLALLGGCAGVQPQGAAISATEVAGLIRSSAPPLILDVRSRDEFAQGHVPGAINIPHLELASRLRELNTAPNDMVIVYCAVGGRASQAETVLRGAGYSNVRDLSGHMRGWQAGGHPVER